MCHTCDLDTFTVLDTFMCMHTKTPVSHVVLVVFCKYLVNHWRWTSKIFIQGVRYWYLDCIRLWWEGHTWFGFYKRFEFSRGWRISSGFCFSCFSSTAWAGLLQFLYNWDSICILIVLDFGGLRLCGWGWTRVFVRKWGGDRGFTCASCIWVTEWDHWLAI